jgi:peptide-methionine (S)-S-oxide reductase
MKNSFATLTLALGLLSACSQSRTTLPKENNLTKLNEMNDTTAIATFGAGCFWCVEACFSEMNGVHQVLSGYMGGQTKNPTYAEVCTGTTGHAEVAQIHFDPSVISYEELLEVFWFVHDPTTLNRQGNDIGTQYRSVVFFHSDEQREMAEFYKSKLAESGAYSRPIVTEISAASEFYVAEQYHQGYFNDNPNQPYCAAVVRPKVDKFRKAFSEKLVK